MTRDFEDERPRRHRQDLVGLEAAEGRPGIPVAHRRAGRGRPVELPQGLRPAERVFPEAHAAPRPDRRGARRLGLPHGPGAAGHRHRRRDRRLLARRVPGGRQGLVPAGRRQRRDRRRAVETADGSRPRAAWAVPDWESAPPPCPPAPPRIRLLSPFDPDPARPRGAPSACSTSTTASRPSSPATSAGTATTCCRSWKASAWWAAWTPSSTATKVCWRSGASGGSRACARARAARPRWRPPSTGWPGRWGRSGGRCLLPPPLSPLQRPLHEQVLARARLLARRADAAGRRSRRAACPRPSRCRRAGGRGWPGAPPGARGSSTGTIASTRKSRLRDIQSAEPM